MSDEKATESKNPSAEEMTKSKGEKQVKEEELDKVTGGRSDGGATVGRANFDVFTCPKGIDTASS